MSITERQIHKLMRQNRRVRVVDSSSRDEAQTPIGYMLTSPCKADTLPVLVYCLEKTGMWYFEVY